MPRLNAAEGTALATVIPAAIAAVVENHEVEAYAARHDAASQAALLVANGSANLDPAQTELVGQCARDPRNSNLVDCLEGIANASQVNESLHTYVMVGAAGLAALGLVYVGASQAIRGVRNHFRTPVPPS